MSLTDLDKGKIKSRLDVLLSYFVNSQAQEHYFHHRNVALPFILKLRSETNKDFVKWFAPLPAWKGRLWKPKAVAQFHEAALKLNRYYQKDQEKADYLNELIVSNRDEIVRERVKLVSDYQLLNGEKVEREKLLIAFNAAYPIAKQQRPVSQSSAKLALNQFKSKQALSAHEYFDQALSYVPVPLLSREKEAVEHFIKALRALRAKTEGTLAAGHMANADALHLARATLDLAESVGDGTVSPEGSIKAFTEKTEHLRSNWGWRVILFAVIGAALGLVAGAMLGVLAGPLAAYSALTLGVKGALYGASLGGAAGLLAGGGFGLWRTAKADPLRQVADAAERVYHMDRSMRASS